MDVRRTMIRRRVLVAFLILPAALLQGGPAEGATNATRKPPYDLGCIGSPPCVVPWKPAREGKLHGATYPCATFYYGPPFVFPSLCEVSSFAGIYAVVRSRGTITVSAKVRGVGTIDLPRVLGTRACLGLLDHHSLGWNGYKGYGCGHVHRGKTTTITTTFDGAALQPGRYLLYVELRAWAAKVVVDTISYRLAA